MRIGKITAACALAVIGLGVAGMPKADAAYVAYLYQDGSNVVATGSGSIDLGGLSFFSNAISLTYVEPYFSAIGLGEDNVLIQVYDTVTPPGNLGSGFVLHPIDATTGSGSAVQIANLGLAVPDGYVSGTALGTSTATFDNTTLAALEVNDGTYVWTWGSGPNADSLTLYIGSAPPNPAPEPASLVLLGTGLFGLALRRRR